MVRKQLGNTAIKSSGTDKGFAIVSYFIVTLTALVMLYPVLNVAAVSISTYKSYSQTPWMFFPYDLDFSSFVFVFNSKLLMNSYLNTIIITTTGTILTLIFTVLTAYPLSRPNLRGKPLIMTFIIFTMIFNGGIIPNFLLITKLGMYDKLIAQILPSVLSAFNVILMINFFRSLPESLIEAAKVDGVSEPYILIKIVLPLSSAILATIALFAAVGYWNSYFSAIMFARKQSNWPVQLVLREIVLSANTQALNASGNTAEFDIKSLPIESLRYATLIVVMLPIMCVYPFLQKYFAKGVMMGSVKE